MKNRFFILVLLAFIFVMANCFKFSQQAEQPASQVNVFELLNGIKDKADVEGSGILEYELYDIPGNESADFQAFIRSYTKSLDEYVFDYTDKRWIEDNTELSINVKILMINHNRNLSITQILNPDGYASFIFNCLNSNGKYEFYAINAYKMYISSTPKTTEKFISRDFAEAYIRRGRAYYWKEDYDQSIEDFTEALQINPKDTFAYHYRGDAYYEKGDYDKAIADYEAALRIDPNDTDIKQALEDARQMLQARKEQQ